MQKLRVLHLCCKSMLLIFFIIIASCTTSSSIIISDSAGVNNGDYPVSDALALLDFKNNLTGTAPSVLASWNISSIPTVCFSWIGISCSASINYPLRVSSIRLPGKSLYGTIAPHTLGRLDGLDTISLRSNKLSGSLPQDLSNLPYLRRLYLQRNEFSGPLPSNFSAWPYLSQLDLSYNRFSGTIPPSLAELSRLRSLSLQNNSLSGSIPPLEVATLQSVDLSNNEFNGSVPPSLATFPAIGFQGNAHLCGPPLGPCRIEPPLQEVIEPKKKLSKWAVVGIVCGAGGLLLVLLLSLCLCIACKTRSEKEETKAGSSVSPGPGHIETDARNRSSVVSDEPKRPSSVDLAAAAATASENQAEDKTNLVFVDNKKLFDLEDLLRASAEVLGKGSLGTAYKAVLEDGLVVAVKRLRDVDDSRRNENLQHIERIGNLKHENLVPLLAYYFDREENLLVYDYMQYGSLAALLHGKRGGSYSNSRSSNPVDWETRLKVAITASRAMAFLHSNQIVHGNIKSSNVLLKTQRGEATMGDYGLVQMVTFAPSAANAAGGGGYTAPEITDLRRATLTSDVYSFGVLLLELLTGKLPDTSGRTLQTADQKHSGLPDLDRDSGVVDLPRWVLSVVRQELTAEIFDPAMINHVNGGPGGGSGADYVSEMMELLQIALPCVDSAPELRPTIVHVASLIQNLRGPS